MSPPVVFVAAELIRGKQFKKKIRSQECIHMYDDGTGNKGVFMHSHVCCTFIFQTPIKKIKKRDRQKKREEKPRNANR